MPELPDITVYIEALRARIAGVRLLGIRLASPFLLRSFDPPLAAADGRRVTGLRRLGKRIVIDLDGDLHLVLHLMIAGRLHWAATDAGPGGERIATARRREDGRQPGKPARIPYGKRGLAAFDFDTGTLVVTEAGSKKRASLHLVASEAELARHDRGGIEVLDAGREAFARALTRERHTLKRALTDQRLLSGIGNAYSDEILHSARLSPVRLTSSLSPEEIEALFAATGRVLRHWTKRLTEEAGDRFPGKVTAFRDGMAVHGRYGKPCPACGTAVQRIVYASNETNYCPTCQTGGKLLADRSLSRLLRKDWPASLEELEALRDPALKRGAPRGHDRGKR
ncbi:MAG TPA: DNA-formamidopyrimidine glycosylase family protein, partial [Candidatus Polarisedimenticolia bacterium]|nr:DNA-formamidopyrimidine glycosylase family protein [Candidatus Polarisedimenticolia bacterium]